MDKNGLLYIEKKPLPYWLIVWIVALPLWWGGISGLFSFPDLIKYTADAAWLILLSVMVFRRTITVEKQIYPLVLLIILFFVYSLVMYIINYRSVIYFLWGVRNNFRFYVFFFAIILFFSESDGKKFFKMLDVLFWINFPITLVQYFFLGYEQDFLGGIFGVEIGVNASTIIFFTIVLSNSLIKYMEKKESFYLCAGKCTVALFISALAELKFFFVFFIIILVMSAMLTAFSWRKLLILALCALVVSAASTLLVVLFGFEGFMSLEAIWKVATQEHYSSDQTVNRLSAIATLSSTIVPNVEDRLLGFGLGNCDTSSFAICNTPFFQTYGFLKYTYFSIAFLFLEVGYVGLIIYVSFFVLCFLLTRNRIKRRECNICHGNVALIMAVLSIVLVVYNASLRAETGYLVYFILALPFLKSDEEFFK